MHFINVLKIINSLFNCLEFLYVGKFQVVTYRSGKLLMFMLNEFALSGYQ